MQADGEPTLHAEVEDAHSSLAETLDIGFFSEDQLPKMHVGHERRVPMAFRLFREDASTAFFDQ